MKNWPFRIGFIVVAIIIAIAWWLFYQPEQPTEVVVTPPPVQEPPPKPVIQHPVTAAPEELEAAAPVIDLEQPLPELKQSDLPMAEILAKLFADEKLDRFFLLDHFIERFVVMIDNLPRAQLPKTHRPIKQTPGHFLAVGERDQLSIDPANYQRYTPMDPVQVVAIYKKLYPLFQEAYEGLGYPDAYFNDRLIEVIDHLLDTPIVADPIFLEQPKALYLFADPELEAFSAGRKILVRSGPENMMTIKAMLRKYRQELVRNNR